jgi:hypothetical protein
MQQLMGELRSMSTRRRDTWTSEGWRATVVLADVTATSSSLPAPVTPTHAATDNLACPAGSTLRQVSIKTHLSTSACESA